MNKELCIKVGKLNNSICTVEKTSNYFISCACGKQKRDVKTNGRANVAISSANVGCHSNLHVSVTYEFFLSTVLP